MTRSRPAAAPRTPETAPSVGLGNLTPAKPVLGHPRGGTGQVCSERGLTWDPAPWVRGVVGERLTCERCGAWVDSGPCGLAGDEPESVWVACRFVFEHVRCEG